MLGRGDGGTPASLLMVLSVVGLSAAGLVNAFVAVTESVMWAWWTAWVCLLVAPALVVVWLRRPNRDRIARSRRGRGL